MNNEGQEEADDNTKDKGENNTDRQHEETNNEKEHQIVPIDSLVVGSQPITLEVTILPCGFTGPALKENELVEVEATKDGAIPMDTKAQKLARKVVESPIQNQKLGNGAT